MNMIGNLRGFRSRRTRAISLLLFTALAVAALSGQAWAAVTLDVQPSGGTYNSIQDAIDAAPTTDTVLIRVAEGVYAEHLNVIDYANLTIEGGWNSTFSNRDASRNTIVFGNVFGGGIDIQNSTVTIDGLKMTGGNAYDGGGIEADMSNLTVRNSKISGNRALNRGGGIDTFMTAVTIENSEISDNIADGEDDDGVGGISIYGGSLILNNSTVARNSNVDEYQDTGGIELNETSAAITNTRILNNSDFEDGTGGIAAYNTNLLLVNTLVAGNYGYNGAGGLDYEQSDNGSDLTIVNSTFANNTGYQGGGAYIDSSYWGDVTIKNSIFWGNRDNTATAPYAEPSDIVADLYSLDSVIFNNNDVGALTAMTDPLAGAGNITADPQYIDPTTGDYRLKSGSPAIDAAAAAGAPAADIDGVARPQGAGIDMGAFEGFVLFDVTAPTASIASPYISSTVSKGHKGIGFDVTWSGSDAAPSSGNLVYDVWYKVGNSGTWQRWLDWTGTTSRRFFGQRGKTYYFKVKAKDGAGNEGAFSGETLTIVPFAGRRGSNYIISRHGFNLRRWKKASSARFLRTQRISSVGGDDIAFRFRKTNQINVIATTGPGRGKFKVLVDGVSKGAIDTKSATKKHRQVVYTIDFAGFGTHKIQLINLGTEGRPTVELDGIAAKR